MHASTSACTLACTRTPLTYETDCLHTYQPARPHPHTHPHAHTHTHTPVCLHTCQPARTPTHMRNCLTCTPANLIARLHLVSTPVRGFTGVYIYIYIYIILYIWPRAASLGQSCSREQGLRRGVSAGPPPWMALGLRTPRNALRGSPPGLRRGCL